MIESFSQDTKKELYTHIPKNKCCRTSELYGLFLGALKIGSQFTIRRDNDDLVQLVSALVPQKRANEVTVNGKLIYTSAALVGDVSSSGIRSLNFSCEHCLGAFMRGVFLTHGRITDPAKAYHMEIVLKSIENQEALALLLENHGQAMKTSKRKNDFLLYRKGSETIEDFLALIGSNKMLFEFINRKIVKDVRNNANRAANCDAGNIRKSLEASQRQIDAVNSLIRNGKIESLPDELKATAYLRLENSSLSLEDLARITSPPISKSGLNHRLEKIIRIAEELT